MSVLERILPTEPKRRTYSYGRSGLEVIGDGILATLWGLFLIVDALAIPAVLVYLVVQAS